MILNKGIKRHQVDQYKEIYTRLGILDEAKKSIFHYSDIAVNSLKRLSKNEDREIFKWIAYSLVDRIR